MTKKERFQKVIEYFKEHRPVAETELKYQTPYELAVAVILSAQCTDKRVNMITPEFFKSFPTVETLAEGSVEHIFELIKSCSYPNKKKIKKAPAITGCKPSPLAIQIVFGYAAALTILKTKSLGNLNVLLN